MTVKARSKKTCPFCKMGMLAPGEVQYCVERGNRVMLLEHVPAMVCQTCSHREFGKGLTEELHLKACEIFDKSHYSLYAYQFSDLVRPPRERPQFETFDLVEIKDDVATWDLYDEHLLPGMRGTILEPGIRPYVYLVRFRSVPGFDKRFALEVEIDENDLELVRRVGEPEKKTKSPAPQRKVKRRIAAK